MKRSKSAQNLKRLMSDVVKPQHEAEAAAKRAQEQAKDGTVQQQQQREMDEAKRANDRRTLYCTSVSRCVYERERERERGCGNAD